MGVGGLEITCVVLLLRVGRTQGNLLFFSSTTDIPSRKNNNCFLLCVPIEKSLINKKVKADSGGK